jgi:Transglycosylase-like domain
VAALIGAVALFAVAAAQPEELEALAAQAGVDVTDLHGAVNTTKLDAWTYLHMTGELQSAPPVRPVPETGIWDRLAQCESNGRWNANTGNGFYGGLQFLPSTWQANGGSGSPHLASRAEQIRVAQIVQSRYGWGQWPACSRRLGLR